MIATVGRPSLTATLQSVVSQKMPDDQVLVISNWPSVRSTATSYGCDFFKCLPGNDWGSTERNEAVVAARGDYLAFIDDDDVAVPDSRVAIESAIQANPGRPLIFRMQYPDTGVVLWAAPILCMGNVGTPMFVLPNDRAKLGTWGKEYGGDFHFISTSAWTYPDFVWCPQVIARIRPNPC
jgi:glycosyltransferase involved in cell wall biosynthesis